MNKIENIFMAKYKILISLLLFAFAAGSVWGQQGQIPETFGSYDPTYIFTCGKIVPIDLYKAANFFVSPEYGYWGDEYGTPYNGKPYDSIILKTSATIKSSPPERALTNGNIFNAVAADSGHYTFYFYVTASNNYCGIKTGQRFILNLYLDITCWTVTSEGLATEFRFCYGNSVEQLSHHVYETSNITFNDLLYMSLPKEEQPAWRKKEAPSGIDPQIYNWDNIEVYSDSSYQNKIGDNSYIIDVSRGDGKTTTDSIYYIKIYNEKQEKNIRFAVRVKIFKEPKLEIYTDPSNITDRLKEYNLDDEITIGDDSEGMAFESYKYYLNRRYINVYGGDTTRKEITLSAATFTGVEDFLEVIAIDTNKCVAKWSSEAIINIPFPTVFTPDGDGVNDILFGGEKYRNREFHLEVFNRWGNILYYGESGWDGTYRGKDVPPGTYEYVIQIKQSDGTTKEVRGTVTLIKKGIN
ncbi:MAG: gliding motility-associated C-terminal domain-containing protein [Prevotellaceae bacterium]|nr:gliding motility-associated C-terminal domain-containing protein [Prevotellaceae bacterium]